MRRPTSQIGLQKAPLLRLSKLNLGKMCSIFFLMYNYIEVKI